MSGNNTVVLFSLYAAQTSWLYGGEIIFSWSSVYIKIYYLQFYGETMEKRIIKKKLFDNSDWEPEG